MVYMEISVQGVDSPKIRGKHSAIVINPQDKTSSYNAALLIGNPAKSSLKIRDDVVIINGPGEYEAGGIKVSGMKADDQTIYTISFENLDVLVGTRESLEKAHQKLKEHNVAIIYANTAGNISFASTLSMNALIFIGEKAREVVDSFAKEEKKEIGKYVISAEKLPTEIETILLA